MAVSSLRKRSWWYWLAPNATAFFASAAVMVLELVAGRLIATHLGMSLYTWTAIIGVMMGGIALGNYAGGLLADRVPPFRALGILFVLGALGTLAILPLNRLVGGWTPLWQLAWPLRIVVHVALTFLGPAMLLGMINPLVAKLALNLRAESGAAVGGVFASGVLGSILGTFFTGFYLIMHQGIAQITAGAALTLAALGVPYLLLSRRAALPSATDDVAPGDAPPDSASRVSIAAAIGTVFLSNAAFMILELAAARVIAREFGASLYTWTTVIGVVLAGISLGNFCGGRIADHAASRRAISAAFLLSSIAALAAPRLAQGIDHLLSTVPLLMTLSWPARIVTLMTGAFFLPNVFLGMISPIVAKRCLDRGLPGGRAVGDIYAWGAAGGIAGTFLAGYWLIDLLWPLPLIAVTALLLAAMAVAYHPRGATGGAWLIACLLAALCALLPFTAATDTARWLGLAMPRNARIQYEDESQYSYVAVLQPGEDVRIREMLLDRLTHSLVDMEQPAALKYEYEWIYEAVIDKFYPERAPLNAFVIGGGGYTFPHYLEVARPSSHVEVAEIDPAVTEAAFQAFGLPRDTSISIYNMDARNRVSDLIARRAQDGNAPVFDCIFGDSINDYTVPFHLTTLEFTKQVHALLADDGLYLLNLIDMYSSGAFLAGVANTCREVFPFVYVFNTGRPAFVRDTFVVVAAKRPINVLDIADRIREIHPEYAGSLLSTEAIDQLIAKQDGLVLTDNYAPVENLLTPVVKTRQADPGEMEFERAQILAASGQLDRAIEHARAALARHPRWPELHEFIAGLLSQQGDIEGAIAQLREAIPDHKRPAVAHYNLGMFFLNRQRQEEALAEFAAAADIEPTYWDAQVEAAKLALALGHEEESIQRWQRAVAIAPDDANAHYNLGLAHAALRQYSEAIVEWNKTLAIKADHENALYNLALAHNGLAQFKQAWEYVNRLRALGKEVDPVLLEALREQSRPAP